MKLAPGLKVNLFASEKEFPDLANLMMEFLKKVDFCSVLCRCAFEIGPRPTILTGVVNPLAELSVKS